MNHHFRKLTEALRRTTVLVLLGTAALAAPPQQPPPGASPLRVSVWYWLNSVPKTRWAADFKAIHSLGFTDVVLVWGLDATAFSLRTSDSHQAIQEAKAAGLGSYLFTWHALHNSLLHRPQFEQVDAAGHTLFAFDAFNQQWRNTQWKTYLQKVAREYSAEPGFAGYIFDNSFAIGHIGAIDGQAPRAEDNYISYGAVEKKMFGRQPPASPDDPSWNTWTERRKQWWAAWALETKLAIRAVDGNPAHEIVLQDGERTIDPDTEARAGLDLSTVVTSFDGMSADWAPAYSDSAADAKLEAGIKEYLQHVRAAVGPNKKLTFSLRLSEDDKENVPGRVSKPTLDQIKRAINAALASGVRQIDVNGYRIGVSHLDGPGWNRYQPGSGPSYPLTGQIAGKFLCDRTELWNGLRVYLRSLKRSATQ
jgi:hypothetical protein